MCQIRVALFVVITTSSLISHSNAASKSCNTDECNYVSKFFLDHMNLNTSPCNDFYDFACGQFSKSSDSDLNVLSRMENVTEIRILQIITTGIRDSDPIPLQKAKMFHDLCIKDGTDNNDPIQPIYKKIKTLGGWPLQENAEDPTSADYLIGTVKRARGMGFDTDALFSLNIVSNVRNTSERVILLTPPPLTVPTSIDDTPTKAEEKELTDYCTLMLMIGFQFAQYDVNNDISEDTQAEIFSKVVETLRFELLLATILPKRYTDKSVYDSYDVLTITQIQSSHPFLKWLESIRAILGPTVTVNYNDKILLSSPSYLSQLQNVYSKLDDKRVVKNYVIWRYILSALQASLVTVPDSLRSIGCLLRTQTGFDPVIAMEYIKKYLSSSDKEYVVGMVNEMKKVMYQIFQNFDWIDPVTKGTVLEKINAILTKVAYNEDMINSESPRLKQYETLTVIPNDFFSSVMYLKKLSLDQIYSLLNKPVDRGQWHFSVSTLMVNAFYTPIENSIYIPAALLQKEIFSADRPLYFNYGSVGFIIGHELSHALDNTGRFYDKYGNRNLTLLDSHTTSAYDDRARCFVDQYNAYSLGKTGIHIDGEKTLGENIADNEGVSIAYAAYKTWIKENREEEPLPNMSYTPEQTFWISTANVWCSKMVNDSTLKMKLKKDEHSPANVRVIGPLSNQDIFAKDFQCPAGSPMNPKKKCTFH